MMRRCAAAGITILVLGGPLPATAEQLGQIGGITGAVKKANDLRDLQVTDAEEQQLGAAVSEKSLCSRSNAGLSAWSESQIASASSSMPRTSVNQRDARICSSSERPRPK